MKAIRNIVVFILAMSTFVFSATDANADKIVFAYMTQNSMPKAQDLERIQSDINEWTLPNIDAEIELRLFANNEYTDMVKLMLASGQQLDIFRSHNTPNLQFIKAGTALDITGYLDTYMAEAVEVLYDDFLKLCMYKGHVYGVCGMGSNYVPRGWVYRSDIVDALDISLGEVESVFDLTDIFARLGEACPGMTLIDSTRASVIFDAYVANDCRIDGLGEGVAGNISGCARMYDPTVVNIYETEEFRQAALLTRDWYEKGYFSRDAASTTATTAELFSSGDCISGFVGLGNPAMAQTYTNNYGYPFKSVCVSGSVFQSGMNDAWMINSKSAAPDASAKFLNLLYTNGYVFNLLTYGQENVDYKFDSDGYVVAPNSVTALNDSPYTNNMNFYLWGNKWLAYRMAGGQDDETYELTKRRNYEAELSPYYGFLFDYDGYEIELSSCKEIVDEFSNALWVGCMDVDSALKEMNGLLYAMGLQRLMDAKQVQLDAWLSNQ